MDVTEVIINDPDFDEGEITKWLKKDNDFVLEGEPLAEAMGFRLLSKQIGNIYSSLPNSMAFSKIRTLGKTFTLNAKSSGRLKILVLPAQPVMQSTIIAKIEKVDGLDKYLTSQQEQLSSQDFTLNQHNNVIDVFYSYDPQDEMLRKELEKHLRNLRSQNIIADWHDRNITAGTEWQRVTSSHLDTAHLILLLVSPDFMASDYRYSIEMQRAMQRHTSGEARVVPILLRPVDWKGAPFASLQILPSTGQPITLWPDRDDAFVNIVREIRNIIQKLLEERLQPLQEQHQAINLQMRDISRDYHYLEVSLHTLLKEQNTLIDQRKKIEKDIYMLQMELQEIQQKLENIPQKQFGYEMKIKDIQQKALELRGEEIRFEQEFQQLRQQIDKVK